MELGGEAVVDAEVVLEANLAAGLDREADVDRGARVAEDVAEGEVAPYRVEDTAEPDAAAPELVAGRLDGEVDRVRDRAAHVVGGAGRREVEDDDPVEADHLEGGELEGRVVRVRDGVEGLEDVVGDARAEVGEGEVEAATGGALEREVGDRSCRCGARR